jgi:SAM-dependent methyltransferase
MTFPFPLFSKISTLKILLYIAILLIVVISIKYFINKNKIPIGTYEGFTQDKQFVLKEDNDIYDDFYIEIYDLLNDTMTRTEYDINKIIDTTQLNPETAYVLDVGCGTGCLVNEFTKKGINVKGIDKSLNMINYANSKYPTLLRNETQMKPIIYQYMEAEDPIIYERCSFSHILCLYMTLYEMKDKMIFLRNAYYGLKPDGYLILHLVKGDVDIPDETSFNGFINLGKPKSLDEEDILKSGIKKLKTNFGGFIYNRDWTDNYKFKESFVDNNTNHIRQNELNWYYEPIDIIMEQSKRCGFSIYKILPENKNIGGFLYFLKKPAILAR